VQLISEKPPELELVLFLDCCFSKGMFRDFVTGNPKYKKSRFLLTEPMPEQFHYIKSATRGTDNFLLLSACAERQTAADAQFNGRYNGAFTFYAVRTLQKGITYRQWMERIWQYLPSDDFDQIPGIDGPERMFDMKVFETA
jgi:metacaspase-1